MQTRPGSSLGVSDDQRDRLVTSTLSPFGDERSRFEIDGVQVDMPDENAVLQHVRNVDWYGNPQIDVDVNYGEGNTDQSGTMHLTREGAVWELDGVSGDMTDNSRTAEIAVGGVIDRLTNPEPANEPEDLDPVDVPLPEDVYSGWEPTSNDGHYQTTARNGTSELSVGPSESGSGRYEWSAEHEDGSLSAGSADSRDDAMRAAEQSADDAVEAANVHALLSTSNDVDWVDAGYGRIDGTLPDGTDLQVIALDDDDWEGESEWAVRHTNGTMSTGTAPTANIAIAEAEAAAFDPDTALEPEHPTGMWVHASDRTATLTTSDGHRLSVEPIADGNYMWRVALADGVGRFGLRASRGDAITTATAHLERLTAPEPEPEPEPEPIPEPEPEAELDPLEGLVTYDQWNRPVLSRDLLRRTHRAEDGTAISLPSRDHIRRFTSNGQEVAVPVRYTHSDGTITDTSFWVSRPRRGHWNVTSTAAITNPEVQGAVEVMVSAQATRGTFASHRAAIAAANEATAGANETSQAAQAVQQARTSESSWATNPERVREVAAAAVARQAAGQSPVRYMTENVMGSLGDRRFGIELEFVGGNAEQIAERLHQQEIIQVPARVPYHWGKAGWMYGERSNRVRWLSQRGMDLSLADVDPTKWQYEFDRSVSGDEYDGVGGEIVSPILTDTPDVWANMERISQTVAEVGGDQNNARAGFHVHVSCGDYDHTPENHTSLAREIEAAEDFLFQAGTNMSRGRHRGTTYCVPPGVVPAAGFESVGDFRDWLPAHRMAVNAGSVVGSEDDHVEFRMFDASPDPAVQQTQMKLAVAVVAAGLRYANDDTPPPPRRIGTSRDQTGNVPLGDQTDEQLQQVGAWLDRLFDRDEDKAQVIELLAVTNAPHRH